MEFSRPEPNLIMSDEGSIRSRGRAGLDVTFRGERYAVSSEMLTPPMTTALYTRGSDRIAADNPDEVYAFVTEGLESIGFTVESD